MAVAAAVAAAISMSLRRRRRAALQKHLGDWRIGLLSIRFDALLRKHIAAANVAAQGK